MGLGFARKITAFSLLTLFAGYVAASTMFMHTHEVEGLKITHSHPYKGKAGEPGHSHSRSEYVLIAQLTALLMVVAAAVFMPRYYVTRVEAVLSSNEAPGTYRLIFSKRLRGPPAYPLAV